MRTNVRDKLTVVALRNYYEAHLVLPSYAEIAKATGIRSKSTVHGIIGRLKSAGCLGAAPNGRLTPGDHFFDVIAPWE